MFSSSSCAARRFGVWFCLASECLLLEHQNVAFGPFLKAEKDADAACKNMMHGWMASGGNHTQKGRLDVKVQEKKSFWRVPPGVVFWERPAAQRQQNSSLLTHLPSNRSCTISFLSLYSWPLVCATASLELRACLLCTYFTYTKVLVFCKGRLYHCAMKKKPFLFFFLSHLSDMWCIYNLLALCNPISNNAITIRSQAICRTRCSLMYNWGAWGELLSFKNLFCTL